MDMISYDEHLEGESDGRQMQQLVKSDDDEEVVDVLLLPQMAGESAGAEVGYEVQPTIDQREPDGGRSWSEDGDGQQRHAAGVDADVGTECDVALALVGRHPAALKNEVEDPVDDEGHEDEH